MTTELNKETYDSECLTYFQETRLARVSEESLIEKAKHIRRLVDKLSFQSDDDFYKAVANGSLKATAEFENLMLRPKLNLFSGTGMFRALSEVIMPDLLSKKPEDKTIRFWVPGCGNGREAYSLALFLNAQKKANPGWKFQIIASDTSTLGLDEAKTARIPYEDIGDILNDLYGSGLKRDSDDFIVKEAVREMITFVQGNFYDFYPQDVKFDAILFRRHLDFWQPNQQQAIIENLDSALNQGGYLVLGPEESLLGLVGNYRPAHNVPGFYKKG